MKITNIRKNSIGTTSFDGKFNGMRKSQDFIVYPMRDAGAIVQIQSENRWGEIDLATGKIELSKSTGHANSWSHSMAKAEKKTKTDEICLEELQTLRQWIKSTGGLLVGGLMLSDNTGAMAL